MLLEPPMELLLVEDNPAEVRLVVEALRRVTTPTHLNVARDGSDALAFLHRQGDHGTAPRPELVLLDLELPRRHGLEVLAEIKADAALRTIPVVILTGSHERKDILVSYGLHANAYVTKPIQLDEFVSAIESTLTFWRGTVTPPPGS